MPLETFNDLEPHQITTSARGIGDAVVGLYGACGIANATGRGVVYHVWHPRWVARAWHPGVVCAAAANGRILAEAVDMNGGIRGYWDQIHYEASRARSYAANGCKGLDIPPVMAARPKRVDRTARGTIPPGPYVVLAPFANHTCRAWAPSKWADLANGLAEAGFTIYAIGGDVHRSTLAHIFQRTAAQWFFGQSPEWVQNLILGAGVLVANDSGMAHVGGLLGVPTVVVHAGTLPHLFLFNMAPTVVSVTPPITPHRAEHNLAALAAITPARVLAAVLAVGAAQNVSNGSSNGKGEDQSTKQVRLHSKEDQGVRVHPGLAGLPRPTPRRLPLGRRIAVTGNNA